MTESIIYDTRLYDLMRQNAINNIEEALIELITNSHDAYISAKREEGGQNLEGFPINVNYNKIERKYTVTDNAKGMTSDEMRKKLLVVGSLTADEFTRGMIGRGAKDITNLGDVTFEAIKNNKYTKLTLYHDLTGEFQYIDIPVTSEIRNNTSIIGNGVKVTHYIKDFVDIPTEEVLIRRMRNNIFLRKMYQNSSHKVKINGVIMIYNEPEGEEILNIKFTVPNYPDAEASFKLFKSKDVIPNPESQMEMKYGVLVTSDQAVYECGGLYIHNNIQTRDMLYNPLIKRVYGELKCDYIDKLARDISINGQTLGNPFLIFDPNRRNGLNKKHPFTTSLFEIPYRWLEIVLNKIQDEIDEYLVTPEDLNSLFNDIENMLQNNLPFENVLYTWRSKTDQENLESMVGLINEINVNKNVLNIDDKILENLKTGENLYPIEKEFTDQKMKFDIKIANNEEMTKPFEVYFYSDKISIRINSRDSSIKTFVDIDGDGKIDIPTEGGMVSVNKTLEDAIIYIMTRQDLMSSSLPTRSDTNNYNEILEIQANARTKLYNYSSSIYESIKHKFGH